MVALAQILWDDMDFHPSASVKKNHLSEGRQDLRAAQTVCFREQKKSHGYGNYERCIHFYGTYTELFLIYGITVKADHLMEAWKEFCYFNINCTIFKPRHLFIFVTSDLKSKCLTSHSESSSLAHRALQKSPIKSTIHILALFASFADNNNKKKILHSYIPDAERTQLLLVLQHFSEK